MTTSKEPLHLGMLNLVHDTYKDACKLRIKWKISQLEHGYECEINVTKTK